MSLKKSRINIILDAILYFSLLAIAFTGLLIKFVLVTGIEENRLYGKDVDLYFLEMNRHQWGDIHFIFSLLFIGLCFIHIFLHWKYIIGIINKMLKTSISSQITLWVSALIPSLILVGILLIKPEIRAHNFQHLNRNHSETIQSNSTDIDHDSKEDIEIWGSMSLIEAANKYDISIHLIQQRFNISKDECRETLGRLRKRHDFSMTQLKDVFRENLENTE